MNSIVLFPMLRGRMDKNRRFGLALLAKLSPSQWFSNTGQESEGDWVAKKLAKIFFKINSEEN
jgi:hypothetical protein